MLRTRRAAERPAEAMPRPSARRLDRAPREHGRAGFARRLRRAVAVALLLAPAAAARAERTPLAVLWLDGGAPERVRALDGALERSPTLRPLDDAGMRRLLVEGGPATRVAARLALGRERFAALHTREADAALAEAEEIALRELRAGEACPQLVEIERLRLRYAELVHDEAAAASAARWLAACLAAPSKEDAAAIARHPIGSAPSRPAAPRPAAPLRIESDPPGAVVLVDLRAIGTTPTEIPAARGPGALVDLELPGYRKVHRAAPAGGGTLSVSLARDDGLAERVDRIRAAAGNAPDAEMVELGRRVGAGRLLVVRAAPGAPGTIQARVLDAGAGAWLGAAASLPTAGAPADGDVETRLLALAAAPAPVAPTIDTRSGESTSARSGSLAARTAQKNNARTNAAAATPPVGAAPAPPVPAWKRWYTWVAGGVLVLGVGAFVVANHLGDDQVTIHVSHP